MPWAVEYFEQADSVQPAETFEDALKQSNPKLAGKLRRVFVGVLEHGRQLGGGLIEPLHDYPSLWEARAISNGWLAREFFGWDGDTAILLHGYVKRVGQKASKPEMDSAQIHWQDYSKTHRVSPEEPEEPQQFDTITSDEERASERQGDGKKGKRQRR